MATSKPPLLTSKTMFKKLLPNLLPVFLVGAFALLLTTTGACTKQKAELLYPKATVGACDTADVRYAAIHGLVQTVCVSCHPGQSAALDNYAAMKSLAVDCLRRIQLPVNAPGHMPDNGASLSACEIATLRQWIAQGYKQ